MINTFDILKPIENDFSTLSPVAKDALNEIIIECEKQKHRIYLEDIHKLKIDKESSVSSKTLSKFSKSIEKQGFLTPISISLQDNSVTDGKKRLKSALCAGIRNIPCVYSDFEFQPIDLKIIKLVKSKNLHFLDDAVLLSALHSTFLFTQEALAGAISSSQSYIANKLRLLNFSAFEREKIKEYELTERTCRSLLRISHIERRLEAIEVIKDNSFSVSASEEYVDGLLSKNGTEQNTRKAVKAIEKLIDSSFGENIVFSKKENDFSITLNITIQKNTKSFT